MVQSFYCWASYLKDLIQVLVQNAQLRSLMTPLSPFVGLKLLTTLLSP